MFSIHPYPKIYILHEIFVIERSYLIFSKEGKSCSSLLLWTKKVEIDKLLDKYENTKSSNI